jgi:hypothetical protein
METEGSLPCSLEPATGPLSDANQNQCPFSGIIILSLIEIYSLFASYAIISCVRCEECIIIQVTIFFDVTLLRRLDPEDGGSMLHCNVGTRLQSYMVPQPRRPQTESISAL